VLRRASAVSFTASGLVVMYSTQGSTSTFSWHWAEGSSVRGYSPAVDHATVAIAGGRVAWTVENLEPVVAFTTAGIDTREPFEVLDSAAGAYGRFVSGVTVANASCAFRLTSTAAPFGAGNGVASLAGDTFESLRRAAGDEIVTYRYRLDGAVATEVDTISSTSHEFVSEVVHEPASAAHLASTWHVAGWRYVFGPPAPLPSWRQCQG